jgi:hypothetical protein
MSKRRLKARAGQIVLTVPGKTSVTSPEKLPLDGQLGQVREYAESVPDKVTWAVQVGKSEFYLETFTAEDTRKVIDAGGLD